MHNIEKECLIDFFKMIDNFNYVVMRNADELPFDNYSNDIDILIDQRQYRSVEKEMKKIFLKHGFERVESTSFFGIECYTFYNIQNDIPHSLKIDLFFNIEGGGVQYYKFEDVVKYKTKNPHGIYVFEPKVEGYLTALKTFAAGGKPKEKYRKLFIDNPLEKEHELYLKCPSGTLKNYLYFLDEHKENPKSVSRRKIVLETAYKNFIGNPFAMIKGVVQHYSLEVSRMFKKQYMVVLVGPDGSGKTTMIERLLADSKIVLRSIPERISMFHHRPHLFPNISDIFKKQLTEDEEHVRNFNPHSGKASNKLVSFFKILYYAMDYRLGYLVKILPLQRENKFIVFDRYFFDFIVDQKRSALKVNESLALQIYKFIVPKPNNVFFIKVNPIEAHNRKKELPVHTIKDINDKYDRLTDKFDYFSIIKNDEIDRSYGEFIRKFIICITHEVKV